MFVTTHAAAGAVLGLALGRPAAGLPVGIASHLAMDALPHWGGVEESVFLPVAVVDGLAGLTAVGLLLRAAPPTARAAVLAGIAGAVAPDLDKPARLLLGVEPFPRAFQALHVAVQRESPRWWPAEVAAAALLTATVTALLRRARTAVAPAPPA